MYYTVEIKPDIFWVGVNDRHKHLFENLWALDNGVSYNSYLIKDEKNVLIDTVELNFTDVWFSKIESIISNEKIDYVVINHIEPDHSGGLKYLKDKFPDIKIIGNKKTANMLKGFFGFEEDVIIVKDGDTINTGKYNLKFFLTALLHWPETMMTYAEEEKILFSGDAFGAYGTLDGSIFYDELDNDFFDGEAARYYSNIVGKYGGPVQKALKKLSGVDIDIIASTHGPVWRSNLEKILSDYDKWSKFEAEEGVVIAYGSMYGNTKQLADALASDLYKARIKKIKIYDVSKTHLSYILSDIFKYKGLLVGTPTYDGEMFPLIDNLMRAFVRIGIKNRITGGFGSYSWSGGGMKKLIALFKESENLVLETNAEAFCSPDAETFLNTEKMAKEMYEKLNLK